MTDSYRAEDVVSENERSLNTLVRSLTRFQGRFSLILVRCNYAGLRDRILQQVRERCSIQIRELILLESAKTLYTTIVNEFGEQPTDALMVLGLESVVALDDLLAATNKVRDQFSSFPFPVVLWVTDGVFKKLVRVAPDFRSWAGPPLQFMLPDEELTGLLRQQAEQVFADESSFRLEGDELEAIEQDLQSRGQELDSELKASLAFMRGLIHERCNQLDAALDCYHHSLAFWQQNSHLHQQGLISLHLGLVYYRKGEQNWQESRNYLQRCLDIFEGAQRSDLVAKYISQLGKVLRGLEDWESLHNLSQKALALHQNRGSPSQLAEDYGFLAEVALRNNRWQEANQSAKQALEILDNSPDTKHHNCGLYHLILAKSQQELDEIQNAISNLEKARDKTQPHQDLNLYLEILAKLRSLYFDQGKYREAFYLKLEQREVESQYSLRAFIGAGRLQPAVVSRGEWGKGRGGEGIVGSLGSSALSRVTAEEKVEIAEDTVAVWGRQQDVERLIDRVNRADCKLTVIYGQSGVGKSSILQAGLVPALEVNYFEGRDTVPVFVDVYTDWVEELGNGLGIIDSTADENSVAKPQLNLQTILEQLRQNEHRHLLTVLIFDQFEEFFFIYKDQASRQPFYEFFGKCLEIPYVKIILSLREDYLHYLLECTRTTKLPIIDSDILSKNIIYHLGNFSREDAKSVIQSLTERSQFYLEPALVDELVKDLAGEVGEVRPIELQIVGAQLQTERITTLEQYQERGSKEELVEVFLEEVVKDCGSENEKIATLVLYLLTDENNTRPLKTRADLELELEVTDEKLDLVLEILVKSRLVLKVQAFPAESYQLVHDYLVSFIRTQNPESARLIAELEREREQRRISEAKMNQVLQEKLLNSELINLVLSSAQNRELDRVLSALKAGIKLKQSIEEIPEETQLSVVTELNNAVYGVRELNRLEGHSGSVTSVSFSSNGKLIVSGSEDKTVKLWNIEGSLLATLEGHNGSVTSVSFSPDGKLLASGSKDKTAKLWNIDGSLLATLESHTGSVTFVIFSPDGKLLASGSEDKTVKLWNYDGTLIKTLKDHKRSVKSISFSPDGKLLASADTSDTVIIWSHKGEKLRTIDDYGVISVSLAVDTQNIILANKYYLLKFFDINDNLIKKKRLSTRYFSSKITALSFSSDKKIVSFVENDFRLFTKKTVIINKSRNWGLSNLDYALKELDGHGDSVNYLSFSFDGKLLASASKDNTVRIWNISSNFFYFTRDNENKFTKVKFSFDGKTIAAGNYQEIKLLSRGGTMSRTIQGNGSVMSLSPDCKTVVTGSTDNVVKFWNIDSGEIRTLPVFSNSVNEIKVSPDGKTIATADRNNIVQIWRSDGTLINTLESHINNIQSLTFSPDSSIIAIIGNNNEVKLWRIDGTLINSFTGHTESCEFLSFSPDSSIIATIGDDNLVKLWKSDGTLIKTLIGHADMVESINFSFDGQILASVSTSKKQFSGGRNSEIKLWRKDGILLKTIDYHYIKSIGFSPDSRIVAAISENNVVTLWSLEGKLLATLKGHQDQVNEVSFSPDGETIATASDDNTVKLWSKDGTLNKTLGEHSDRVTSVSFSSDSQTLASVSEDKTVKIWSRDGHILKTLQGFSSKNRTDIVRVSFSYDDRIINCVSDNKMRLWNRDGEEIKVPGGQNLSKCNNISFSLDSRTVAFGVKDTSLKLWGVDGNLLATFKGHNDQINSVSFSPDGETIATASDDKTVKLWRSDGTLLQTMEGHSDKVNSVGFSLDSQTIATASDDKTVKLWRSDGTLLQTMEGHSDKVNSVSFSPDGQTIASASNDEILKLWSRNGTLLKTLKVEMLSDSSGSIDFSPDSKILACATWTGVTLHILNGTWFKKTKLDSIKRVEDVSFSPDGKAIAVTTEEGIVVLSLDLDKLLERGCNWVRGYLKNNPNVEESD
ncbi:MAG: hypothetical protein F6J89_12120, partial [Symploca sp. SIO1C4]|nr:hypothetical protein [Symploca sp. SIO1C4]